MSNFDDRVRQVVDAMDVVHIEDLHTSAQAGQNNPSLMLRAIKDEIAELQRYVERERSLHSTEQESDRETPFEDIDDDGLTVGDVVADIIDKLTPRLNSGNQDLDDYEEGLYRIIKRLIRKITDELLDQLTPDQAAEAWNRIFGWSGLPQIPTDESDGPIDKLSDKVAEFIDDPIGKVMNIYRAYRDFKDSRRIKNIEKSIKRLEGINGETMNNASKLPEVIHSDIVEVLNGLSNIADQLENCCHNMSESMSNLRTTLLNKT